MRFRMSTALLCAALLSIVPMASAQTATGQVNGTITDNTGAVVPGATLKLINLATGIESIRSTNDSGGYVFVNVPPGPYRLRVAKEGFKEAESSLTVAVSQAVTLDVRLDLGAVTETVDVTADAALVQTTTTELGTVISQRVVNDLPLNGRNFTQLLTLTPGVTPVSTSQNRNVGCCEGNVGIPGSGFSDPSFHGQQNRSKLYFFDGIINTNIRGPTYIVIPNIDMIQEFMVVGHDAKAEFGGATGGVVNMVSKSGGNALHGSAFEYVRNNFFDARNALDGRQPDGSRRIPAESVWRRRLPARSSRTRLSSPPGTTAGATASPRQALSYVPTAAEVAGDFTNTAIVRHDIYNPYSTRASGTGFVRDRFRCDGSGVPLPVNAQRLQDQSVGVPCNKIPQALIFAPMQQFFQTYSAQPNYAVAGTAQQLRPEPFGHQQFQQLSDQTRPPFPRRRQRLLPLYRASRSGFHSDRTGRLHGGRFAGQELRRRVDSQLRPQHGAGRARRLCGQARRGCRPAELASGRHRGPQESRVRRSGQVWRHARHAQYRRVDQRREQLLRRSRARARAKTRTGASRRT